MNVAFCSVEVTATDRSLDRRSPTECGVSECDLETSTTMSHRPTRLSSHNKKVLMKILQIKVFECIN